MRGQLRTWPAWTRRNAPDSLLADQMRSAHLNYTNSKTDASRSQAVPFYFARACGDLATRPARQSENPGGSKARRQLPCSAIVVVRSRAQRNSAGSAENGGLSSHGLHASMHRTDYKIRPVAGSRNAQSAIRSVQAVRIAGERMQCLWHAAPTIDRTADIGWQVVNVLRIVTIFRAECAAFCK